MSLFLRLPTGLKYLTYWNRIPDIYNYYHILVKLIVPLNSCFVNKNISWENRIFGVKRDKFTCYFLKKEL